MVDERDKNKKKLAFVVVSKIESTMSKDLCHALDCGMIGSGIDDDDDRCLSLVYSLL
jgi:hypothetical protein